MDFFKKLGNDINNTIIKPVENQIIKPAETGFNDVFKKPVQDAMKTQEIADFFKNPIQSVDKVASDPIGWTETQLYNPPIDIPLPVDIPIVGKKGDVFTPAEVLANAESTATKTVKDMASVGNEIADGIGTALDAINGFLGDAVDEFDYSPLLLVGGGLLLLYVVL
jgi:hypothetical protein